MKTKKKRTRRNLQGRIKKIALVDDHPVFRLGLTGLLKELEDIEISFEAANGIEALDKLKTCKPDIILMDLEMPLMNGIEATELVRKLYPDIKIVILTMHESEEFVTHLLKLGCNGYLLKDYKIDLITEAIHRVAENKFFFKDHFNKTILKQITRSKMSEPVQLNEVLTEREKDILQMICNECSNKEIAEKFCISIRTVERHRENMMQKMGVKNTVGMVIYAVKNGLVR